MAMAMTMAMAMGRFAVWVCLVVFFLGGFVRAGDGNLVIDLESQTVLLGSDKAGLEVVVKAADGGSLSTAIVSLISVHSVASGAPVSWASHNARFTSRGEGKYELGVQPGELSLGKYKVRVDATSSDGSKGFLAAIVAVTATMTVSTANVALFDSEGTLADLHQKVKFGESVTVSAIHSQKLKLGFQITSPSAAPFTPQFVMVKLRHVESGTEVTEVVSPAPEGSGYEHALEFSKIVAKLDHQSGAYTVSLIVGDDVMENSFLWSLVSLDLELPEGPESATTSPSPAVSKYAPKAEIAHIFRQPEKRPPTYLSMAFLVLTLLPLVGFFLGLQQVGVTLRNLPSGGLPFAASVGFHGGIFMILVLYFMFWLKLNLFTTLQILGFLGLFTIVPGFRILSYLADHSAKVKSA